MNEWSKWMSKVMQRRGQKVHSKQATNKTNLYTIIKQTLIH